MGYLPAQSCYHPRIFRFRSWVCRIPNKAPAADCKSVQCNLSESGCLPRQSHSGDIVFLDISALTCLTQDTQLEKVVNPKPQAVLWILIQTWISWTHWLKYLPTERQPWDSDLPSLYSESFPKSLPMPQVKIAFSSAGTPKPTALPHLHASTIFATYIKKKPPGPSATVAKHEIHLARPWSQERLI